MTTENHIPASAELLMLASNVNHVCELEPGDVVDQEELRERCQSIINNLHPTLKGSRDHFSLGIAAPRMPGRRALTSTESASDFGERSIKRDVSMQFGIQYVDRIGNYKVTKTREYQNWSLNFHYFIMQVTDQGYRIGIGQQTHLLYDRKTFDFTGLVRSLPQFYKLFGVNIISYKHIPITGKGKIKTSTFEFII